MFQTVQVDEIFDMSKAQASEDHPSYWLAQLRKADWQKLVKFAGVTPPASLKKCDLVRMAPEHFE